MSELQQQLWNGILWKIHSKHSGMWDVCGAVSSLWAALSIIEGTGPLSTDDSWGNHMLFTSNALKRLSQIGGLRCCKRDAYLSFEEAIQYCNKHFHIHMDCDLIACSSSEKNEQCIQNRCPFYQKSV